MLQCLAVVTLDLGGNSGVVALFVHRQRATYILVGMFAGVSGAGFVASAEPFPMLAQLSW